MKRKEFFDYLKKTWAFIWYDDSLLSWALNILLAIILIKFVVYPGLGLVLSTPYPIVAVVSGSMEHDGSFDDFWDGQGRFYEDRNITKEIFLEYSYRNGFNTGDIMILYGTRPKNIDLGDVIVFQSPARPDPIIHRVVNKWESEGEYHYTTKGDHNPAIHDNIGEDDIVDNRVIGRAVFRVPYLGWVKIAAFEAWKFLN
ncbi:signal peptidase I [Candidatus Woesearchaeota archaeon]|nr:signal peptidase I [Candidatus Woesearchaeota archaeon]